MPEKTPDLLRWARELYTLSQAGLTYSKNEFDLERYRKLQEMAAEMLASQSDETRESILHGFSLQAGYATPKIDVRGAVIRDNKILLIQEQSDHCWAMPGGWADIGDLPAETVRREVREESGFEVRVEKVIAVLDANRIAPLEFYHAYKIIFQCSITDGQPATSNETLAVAFFAMDDLPPLSEGRTNRAMLEEVFAHQRDPARPTAFD